MVGSSAEPDAPDFAEYRSEIDRDHEGGNLGIGRLCLIASIELKCPLWQITDHTPRQLVALLQTAAQRHARTRLERLQETYAAMAACWSQEAGAAFDDLQRELIDLADPPPNDTDF